MKRRLRLKAIFMLTFWKKKGTLSLNRIFGEVS